MYLPHCNAHHITHENKLVEASVIVMQPAAAHWCLTMMLAADQFSLTKTHVYQWQCESGLLKRNARQVCPRV